MTVPAAFAAGALVGTWLAVGIDIVAGWWDRRTVRRHFERELTDMRQHGPRVLP